MKTKGSGANADLIFNPSHTPNLCRTLVVRTAVISEKPPDALATPSAVGAPQMTDMNLALEAVD